MRSNDLRKKGSATTIRSQQHPALTRRVFAFRGLPCGGSSDWACERLGSHRRMLITSSAAGRRRGPIAMVAARRPAQTHPLAGPNVVAATLPQGEQVTVRVGVFS